MDYCELLWMHSVGFEKDRFPGESFDEGPPDRLAYSWVCA